MRSRAGCVDLRPDDADPGHGPGGRARRVVGRCRAGGGFRASHRRRRQQALRQARTRQVDDRPPAPAGHRRAGVRSGDRGRGHPLGDHHLSHRQEDRPHQHLLLRCQGARNPQPGDPGRARPRGSRPHAAQGRPRQRRQARIHQRQRHPDRIGVQSGGVQPGSRRRGALRRQARAGPEHAVDLRQGPGFPEGDDRRNAALGAQAAGRGSQVRLQYRPDRGRPGDGQPVLPGQRPQRPHAICDRAASATTSAPSVRRKKPLAGSSGKACGKNARNSLSSAARPT